MKDEFQPEEKQVKNMNDLGFIPLDPAPLADTKGWQSKSVASDNARIDNGNFLLADQDGIVRFFAGRDVNGEWVVKLSKQGIDARIATNSQVLFSSNVIFFEQTFTTRASVITNAGSLFGIQFNTSTNSNTTDDLSFYIEPDWTITQATLRVQVIGNPLGSSIPAGFFVGVVNLDNAAIRINPTRTTIPPAPFTASQQYYFYTGGTVIVTGLAPTVAEEATQNFDYTLSAAQIAVLASGWNDIILQQETDDSGRAPEHMNSVNMTLVIRGYVNL